MSLSFLRRGRDAKKLQREADKRDSLRKARRDAPRRFWVPEDKTVRITFLDGTVKDGMLDAPTYNEHRVRRNGQTEYYPCLTSLDERCPLCADGEKVTLVSVYTVIDHSKWKDREGKVRQHERRLYVVNRDVAKKLEKLAAKRGGLEGCTFEVSRSGSYSPSVGNTFEFVGKRTLSQIRTKYNLRAEDVTPFDYDKAIRLYTTEELESLGFGDGGDEDRRRRSKDDDDKGRKPPRDDADDDAGSHLDDDLDESDFEDEDETPRSKKKASKRRPEPEDEDDADGDDADAVEDDDEDEDEDEAPRSSKKKAAKKKARRVVDEDDDEDESEDEDDEVEEESRALARNKRRQDEEADDGLGSDDDDDEDADDEDEDEDDEKFPPSTNKKKAKKKRSILRR